MTGYKVSYNRLLEKRLNLDSLHNYDLYNTQNIPICSNRLNGLEKSEYAVTPFKLNEMPKINEISHFAHIDYQAFAINDCAACF